MDSTGPSPPLRVPDGGRFASVAPQYLVDDVGLVEAFELGGQRGGEAYVGTAGGNLAVVTAMRARDEGLPLPAALVLISPVLDLTFSGASVDRNDGLDPMLRAATVRALPNAPFDPAKEKSTPPPRIA